MDDGGIALTGVPGAANSLDEGRDNAVPKPPPVDVDEIDPAIEKRLRRKLDRRVVGVLFLLYLVAFLDRSNIGNAQTAGMGKDLGFDDEQFQWLLTIFYIPYILFEWLAIMWKLVPPHIWASVTVLIWGLASTLQAVAFNWQGLMACRAFLALAEAGFGPGVPYLLSFFYRRHELGLRCGLFLSAAPLATAFAGALAYAITSTATPLPSWRLLFLAEGLPAVLLSLAAFYLLPDSPDTASFLIPAERHAARARAVLQAGRPGVARLGSFAWPDALAALRAPHTWLQPLMFFSCNVSFSSLPVFLPSVLSHMGFSAASAQGLTAPPYLLAFVVCIATTYLADRTRQRAAVIGVLSLVGAVGYIVLATAEGVGTRYAALFLTAAGVFPAIANILPWVLNNQGTDAKRGLGIAMLNVVGQCGPLLGTRMFPAREAPYYRRGMVVCAGFMGFNAVLAGVLRVYFVRENRMIERGEGGRAAEVGEEAVGGSEMEGALGYRFVL
ncbi:major facilitator superfamily transporter [Schizothecium vesticola]|uniref:Major facilitator superfamily transporter n=1 Tax=Schizothecium vesticola TaxID=314040 RepID=A0AA40EPJ7_9PEZI|nr:major facilitator superfamily transporter [Schizothecium vesticola]